jgi:hypothetical protein
MAQQGPARFSSAAGIAPVVPMLLFVILFGLSMDYHVFIISRIRETTTRAHRWTTRSHGIKSTAGVVTSAAVVWSPCSRSCGPVDAHVQTVRRRAGSAILIDATVVRGVLLPATMKLLGERAGTSPAGSTGSRGSARARKRKTSTRDQPQPPRNKGWDPAHDTGPGSHTPLRLFRPAPLPLRSARRRTWARPARPWFAVWNRRHCMAAPASEAPGAPGTRDQIQGLTAVRGAENGLVWPSSTSLVECVRSIDFHGKEGVNGSSPLEGFAPFGVVERNRHTGSDRLRAVVSRF